MTAVADSEAWVSPLQQQVSEVGSAFTGIGADKLKKYSIWHNEASVLAPGPLAPCLAEPGQGDSLLRVVVPPVMHLMNIKIMYL